MPIGAGDEIPAPEVPRTGQPGAEKRLGLRIGIDDHFPIIENHHPHGRGFEDGFQIFLPTFWFNLKMSGFGH
jgi:hypothetical protein